MQGTANDGTGDAGGVQRHWLHCAGRTACAAGGRAAGFVLQTRNLPLAAMRRSTFNPPLELKPMIPPSAEDNHFRKRVLQGEVQDENASALGGVAGHAGLFAPVLDVAQFAHCLLQKGAPLWRSETVALLTRRETSPPGTSRALGWDTP